LIFFRIGLINRASADAATEMTMEAEPTKGLRQRCTESSSKRKDEK